MIKKIFLCLEIGRFKRSSKLKQHYFIKHFGRSWFNENLAVTAAVFYRIT
jgi:hypothetical protein